MYPDIFLLHMLLWKVCILVGQIFTPQCGSILHIASEAFANDWYTVKMGCHLHVLIKISNKDNAQFCSRK
jgi:hypothetical protein